jgi:hypothetical protein
VLFRDELMEILTLEVSEIRRAHGHSTFTAFKRASSRSLWAATASASESKWNVTHRVVLSWLLTLMT